MITGTWVNWPLLTVPMTGAGACPSRLGRQPRARVPVGHDRGHRHGPRQAAVAAVQPTLAANSAPDYSALASVACVWL